MGYAGEALQAVVPGDEIIGRSAAIRKLLADLPFIGASDAPVLVHGESGTGKELVARAIHRQSGRADGPLVALNCAAMPDTLLEDELFGHERGAFTGASQRRPGRFEQAHGGTLFLDEVGELSAAAQAKLLRVLQDGAFEPLGAARTVRVDVRVVSATHRDLRRSVEAGRFREDLFYRLKVLSVSLPPLRERREDLPLLIASFLAGQGGATLGESAARALAAHPFPGNVRELRHALAHAAIMARGGRIERQHLPREIAEGAGAAEAPPTLAAAARGFERQHLLRALRYCAGHRGDTARVLGISRKTLWQKMREHRIQAEEYGRGGSLTPPFGASGPAPRS